CTNGIMKYYSGCCQIILRFISSNGCFVSSKKRANNAQNCHDHECDCKAGCIFKSCSTCPFCYCTLTYSLFSPFSASGGFLRQLKFFRLLFLIQLFYSLNF